MTTRAQIDSWRSLQPRLTDRQEAVLAVIRDPARDGATLREIADALGLELNQVSGRVTELQHLRLVCDSERTRLNPKSGKHIAVWVQVGPGQISLL